MNTTDNARGRVEALLSAARRLANPTDPLGQRARAALREGTPLTPEAIEWGFANAWESNATCEELDRLLEHVTSAPRAWVLLSANVFVAPLRAIALALASSASVVVRPSRREPSVAELLREGCPGAFRLVDALAPAPGEHVWAYGRGPTLEHLRRAFPGGVVLHAHGPGLGVAVIEQGGSALPIAEQTARLAQDAMAFDQRGCLSPRLALLRGSRPWAEQWAQQLATSLARFEQRIPRGTLAPEEASASLRYRDTMAYSGTYWPAGKGGVGFAPEGEQLVLPPPARIVHAVLVDEPLRALESINEQLTCVGAAVSRELHVKLARGLPSARLCALGEMQRPPFDGPVDRRQPPQGELL